MINKGYFMYKLMVKTHNKTLLKYLCITSRENWKEYTGSGVHWKRHLAKHGVDFSTELMYASDNYDDFVEQCLFYSVYYDVALSQEFANAIPESGYNTTSGKPEILLWWDYATEEMKKEIYQKRSMSLKKTWSTYDETNRKAINDKISVARKENWVNTSIRDRKIQLERMKVGLINFIANKGENYEKWKINLSKSAKIRVHNTPFAVFSARMSKARLNLSQEKKDQRKEKIRQVYATGKHDEMFLKMSKDRMGIDNPAAKIYMWMGLKYNSKDFNALKKAENLSNKFLYEMFLTRDDCIEPEKTIKKYDVLICPHCKHISDKKPSSFKRWHFNNCKQKETHE